MSIHFSLTALFVLLVVLIICSAFFSCAETSMMASNRYRMRHAAKSGNRSALRVEKLLRRPEQLLGTILIGNTFANILASSIATLIAAQLWGELGVFIATIVLTLVVLIFGEVMPKTIAAYRPNAFALILSWPLGLLRMLFYPLVRVINAVSSLILSPFGIDKPSDTEDHLSSEELRTVVDEASGRIPLRHRRML